MKEAIDRISGEWAARTGHSARASYAGSSALAKQIAEGAPASLFISANQSWMDDVERQGLLAAGTRHDLAGNRLVLVSADASADTLVLDRNTDITGLLDGGRLAMALVDSVPAGIYGKAALEWLGQWETVRPYVVQADNVRSALAFVALGEAELGIVYATDARAQQGVREIATFPPGSHPPITYPGAIIADGDTPEAREFLRFLLSNEAAAILAELGFSSGGN